LVPKTYHVKLILRSAQFSKPRKSLSVKYRQNRSGAKFVRRFLVGRKRDSLFTLALPRNWMLLIRRSSLLSAKRTSKLATLLKINQTGQRIFLAMLHGRFIRWWSWTFS